MPGKREPEKSLTPGAIADQAQAFFGELDRNGLLPRGVSADDAAAAVFCTLTRRVGAGEAQDFAESMPPMVRRLLFRCRRHRAEPAELFDRQQFVRRVAAHLDISARDAERVAQAVLSAMRACLPQSEVDDVANRLPPDLRELWRPQPPGGTRRIA